MYAAYALLKLINAWSVEQVFSKKYPSVITATTTTTTIFKMMQSGIDPSLSTGREGDQGEVRIIKITTGAIPMALPDNSLLLSRKGYHFPKMSFSCPSLNHRSLFRILLITKSLPRDWRITLFKDKDLDNNQRMTMIEKKTELVLELTLQMLHVEPML
jgi:hypothetical protein